MTKSCLGMSLIGWPLASATTTSSATICLCERNTGTDPGAAALTGFTAGEGLLVAWVVSVAEDFADAAEEFAAAACGVSGSEPFASGAVNATSGSLGAACAGGAYKPGTSAFTAVYFARSSGDIAGRSYRSIAEPSSTAKLRPSGESA